VLLRALPSRKPRLEEAQTRTPHRKEPSVASTASTLTRPREGRVIAGVCAGLAQRFGMSTGLVRFLFLISCLLPGPQFLIYIVLWIIMPAGR
jgi:phage shock protein C